MKLDPRHIKLALGMLLAHGRTSVPFLQRKMKVSVEYAMELVNAMAAKLDAENLGYEIDNGRITLKWE